MCAGARPHRRQGVGEKTRTALPAPATLNRRKALWAGAGVLAAALALSVGLNLERFGGPGTGVTASPRIASIAVLPLDNFSGDPDQEPFSDGLTEGLITELAKIGALKVISRTSVMRYKGDRQAAPRDRRRVGCGRRHRRLGPAGGR